MMVLPLLFAASAILPSDRMQMADRMFDMGDYDGARAEYQALITEPGVPGDELLFRLAETARVKGQKAESRARYLELVKKFPKSRHANRARLKGALAGTPEDRKRELPPLDSDEVAGPLRAEALYHLAVLSSDPKLYERCVKQDPKGPYANAARFRWAALLEKSARLDDRRTALGLYQELSKAEDKTCARKALYMAICSCYTEKWPAVQKLASRYFREFPGGEEETRVRVMLAWTHFLAERYTDAELACATVENDDLSYLRAACALKKSDSAKALRLFARYLENYPQGRYRAQAELQHARQSYLAAAKDGSDKSLIVDAARQSAKLSKTPMDRLRYAWSLENAGNEADAMVEYAALAKDCPKTEAAAEGLFRKAMLDVRAERWAAADLALSEALAGGLAAERRAEALYWRGITSYRLGHETEGVGSLKQALQLGLQKDPEREAKLVIADFDYKSGREAEAKAAYADLVVKDNESCGRMSPARLYNVGRFLLGERGGSPRPDAAEVCARALVKQGGTPEWRQVGYALLGDALRNQARIEASIEAYRQAEKEPANPMTADLPSALLALGALECRTEQFKEAEATLSKAIRLFADDPHRRVQAYLELARASKGSGAFGEARRYATIVKTLFNDEAASDAADQLLKTLPEVKP